MSKNSQITNKQHVLASFRDGMFTSFNVGLTESYFAAFMLALGIGEITAGLSLIVAQFLGVIFQLLSLRLTFKESSLKKRLLILLALQGCAFIPLSIMGYYNWTTPWVMTGVLGFYWGNLLSLNPPWSRLIGHTVPHSFRLRFFSLRNQYGQFSVFMGLATAGLILYVAKRYDLELHAFLALFLAGFILKLLSWWEVRVNHLDYEIKSGTETHAGIIDFIKGLKGTEQGKLILFLFFFYITVHTSASFFNPYMLGVLKFNYIEFMIVVAIFYFGRVLGYRVLQKKAKIAQANQILLISTLGIALNPLLWAISTNYVWVLGIEFLSGCYWAGFELSTVLLFYQKIGDRERTSVMTYISFFNITGMVIGCSIGALFMYLLPIGWDKFITLFVCSTFLRLIMAVFSPQLNFKNKLPKNWKTVRLLGRRFSRFPGRDRD